MMAKKTKANAQKSVETTDESTVAKEKEKSAEEERNRREHEKERGRRLNRRRSIIRNSDNVTVNDPLREVIFRAALIKHRAEFILSTSRCCENPPHFQGEFALKSFEALCDMQAWADMVTYHAVESFHERDRLENDLYDKPH